MELNKNNFEGKSNKKIIGNYNDDVYMMKYNEVYIGEVNEYSIFEFK